MSQSSNITVAEESAATIQRPSKTSGAGIRTSPEREGSVNANSRTFKMYEASSGRLIRTVEADPVQTSEVPAPMLTMPGPSNTEDLVWNCDNPAGEQTNLLCGRLAETGAIYNVPERGMFRLEVGKAISQISEADDLEGFIRARFSVTVVKEGKVKGRAVPRRDLAVLLRSDELMSPLPTVDHVTATVTYNSKWEMTRPGYNAGDAGDRYFYSGETVVPKREPTRIREFIGTMNFKAEADATNAVAFALTSLLRFKWLGDKPFIVVSANQPGVGKDTTIDFGAGRTKRAEISLSDANWATEDFAVKALRDQEVGVLVIGNVRGNGKIQSQFIERTITAKTNLFQTTKMRDTKNREGDFLIAASANDGSFIADLMSRALPIRLEYIGDIHTRKSALGEVRGQYLPRHCAEIEAELCGMIENWKDQGSTPDESVSHRMLGWAQTVGGILKANGFEGFLGNLDEARDTGDAECEALWEIAHHARHDEWLLAPAVRIAAQERGVIGRLMNRSHRESNAAVEQRLFKLLSNHLECILSGVDENDVAAKYRIRKTKTRNGAQNTKVHYMFETIKPE